MARIWRGGCIIRARFLNRITEAYERTPDLALLISDEYFTRRHLHGPAGVAQGGRRGGAERHPDAGVFVLVRSSTTASEPTAAGGPDPGTREFFGAHTYHRIDKPGTFHTEWTGDRTESTLDAGEARSCRRSRPRLTRPLPDDEGGLVPVVRLVGLRSYARLAREKLGNQLTAGRFAGEVTANGAVPDEAVALFFAVGPENAYQFEQWRLPLEALATRRPVVVIVDRPDTGRLVLATSSLPIAFARASGELETLVERHRFAAVLYPNQVEQNFRMLRFAEPVHIQSVTARATRAAASRTSTRRTTSPSSAGRPVGTAGPSALRLRCRRPGPRGRSAAARSRRRRRPDLGR